MSSQLRIVVTGLIAQYPVGGFTWDCFQYVLGLARLGHDVYYLEDSGQWPYNPVDVGGGQDCSYNVRYLAAARVERTRSHRSSLDSFTRRVQSR